MRLGILFPGQGTQYSGMGKTWYESHRLVQQYFEKASSCLSFNVAHVCFGAQSHELQRTRNAQISTFVLSCALFHVLQQEAGIEPALLAGHSSGQYAALRSARALSFADALYLLDRRAQLMQSANNTAAGSMLAVLGLDEREVRALCAACDRPRSRQWVAQLAAHNGPIQSVISCTKTSLPQVRRAIETAGGRSRILAVDGAFHSRLMSEAQQQLVCSLPKVTIATPRMPVVSNISAQPLVTDEQVKHELAEQMCAPVNWWRSMRQFANCDLIIQVGPGTTFAKILQRHWPEKKVIGFNSTDDLRPVMDLIARVRIEQPEKSV